MNGAFPRSIDTAAATITIPSTVSCSAAGTKAPARAPAKAPSMAMAPNVIAERRCTRPQRQWLTAPVRLVSPTTGRLMAMASLGGTPRA